MTYITEPSRALRRYRQPPRARRTRQGMGGIFDFVDDLIGQSAGFAPGDAQQLRINSCANDAIASVSTPLAQVDDLERTWNPTGFYTVEQMQKVILTTLEFTDNGYKALQNALDANSINIRDSDHTADAPVFDKAYDEFTAAKDKGQVFIDAFNKAKQQGVRAINAPGLKLWVLAVMRATIGVMRAAFFIICNRSAYERVSSTVSSFLDKAASVIKTVVGTVLEVGEKALDTAGDLMVWVVRLIKYAPYLIVAGGGLYLYRQYKGR